jgi:hypothetical protein
MPSLTKISIILNVTSSTKPLKVTICWMDPTNSIISAKLLLHDIDLVIEQGATMWYGNKQAGDERNNVEQVNDI